MDSAERPRPSPLSLGNVALVAVGGSAGTGLRYLIGRSVPHWAGVPVATLAINVLGAFLLGWLLEGLARSLGAGRRAQQLRLMLGTGGLGGFTTYSALATDTVTVAGQDLGLAVAYALGTVVLGAAAATAGITLGRLGGRG